MFLMDWKNLVIPGMERPMSCRRTIQAALPFPTLATGAFGSGPIAVGIGLPTQDDPRWIQDGGRFQAPGKGVDTRDLPRRPRVLTAQ